MKKNIKMAKKPANQEKKWLIFIDTNIFLDFYRFRSGVGSLSLLGHIENNVDKIITGNQVEMEFMKNRHKVMLNSLSQLKTPDWAGLTAPAFLADTQLAQAIIKNRENIDDQHKRLKKKLASVLKNPTANDEVYQCCRKLFEDDGLYNLNRKKDIRYRIRRKARKRFMLGYPPRKDKDTSIGDAINWEWIIHCAEESGKHVVIVSRDTDYGIKHDGVNILNDWLLREFKDRLNRRRKIILTDRLAEAFKMVSVRISQKEEKEEEILLRESTSIKSHSVSGEEIYPESNPLIVSELVKRFNELKQQQNKIMHEKSGSDS